MSERLVIASPEHEVTMAELARLLAKRTKVGVSAIELLAIASNMVGKLVALQDQRATTTAQAMEVVSRNIEVGNRQVVEALTTAPTTATH